MKKILVLGTGGHAKSCIDVVEKQRKFRILGIIENVKSNQKKFMGYSILGNDQDLIKIKKLAQEKGLHNKIIFTGLRNDINEFTKMCRNI